MATIAQLGRAGTAVTYTAARSSERAAVPARRVVLSRPTATCLLSTSSAAAAAASHAPFVSVYFDVSQSSITERGGWSTLSLSLQLLRSPLADAAALRRGLRATTGQSVAHRTAQSPQPAQVRWWAGARKEVLAEPKTIKHAPSDAFLCMQRPPMPFSRCASSAGPK